MEGQGSESDRSRQFISEPLYEVFVVVDWPVFRGGTGGGAFLLLRRHTPVRGARGSRRQGPRRRRRLVGLRGFPLRAGIRLHSLRRIYQLGHAPQYRAGSAELPAPGGSAAALRGEIEGADLCAAGEGPGGAAWFYLRRGGAQEPPLFRGAELRTASVADAAGRARCAAAVVPLKVL